MGEKSISPPPPTTGFAHKKCLLRQLSDCDTRVSREHVLSAAVLKHISEREIVIEGPHARRTLSIRSDSLTTKCFCTRHNSALGPLDDEAGRLFKAVLEVEETLAVLPNGTHRLKFFCGLDVERWLVKACFATYSSRVIGFGQQGLDMSACPVDLLCGSLSPPFGLYIPGHADPAPKPCLRIERKATLALVTCEGSVVGITVQLAGIELILITRGTDAQLERVRQQCVYRPRSLCFYQGTSVAVIWLAWTQGGGRDIWISRGDPNAPPPYVLTEPR